jgi:hypothetical protein
LVGQVKRIHALLAEESAVQIAATELVA